MLRKLVLMLIVMSVALLSLLSGTIVQGMSLFIGPYISIQSPDSTRTYTNTSLPFELVASVRYDRPEIIQFSYSVDHTANITLTNVTRTSTVGGYDFHASAVLSNLPQGNHTLDATSSDASGETMSTSVEFKIDISYKSPFLLLSPKNTTYQVGNANTTEVNLTYSCSEQILWSYYHLWIVGSEPQNREGRVTGNLTLSDLPPGNYLLTVDGWSNSGPINQAVYFAIKEPTPFLTVIIIAVIITVILVSAGLLVYYKKRKNAGFD